MADMSKPGKLVFIVVAAALVLGVNVLVFRPDGPAPGDPANAVAVAVGARLYGAHCASCHGDSLQGEANWKVARADGVLPAPPHDASGHTWHHGDDLLFRYTKLGGAAIGPAGFKSGMPGFGDRLSDAEIWDVLAFIKSTWPEDIRAAQSTR